MIPVLVDSKRGAAISATDFIPLGVMSLFAGLAQLWRMIPVSVCSNRSATRGAVDVIPLSRFQFLAGLADTWRVRPIFTDPHFITAALARYAVPVCHEHSQGPFRIAEGDRSRSL